MINAMGLPWVLDPAGEASRSTAAARDPFATSR